MTSVQLGPAKTVVHVGKSLEPGALSVVVVLATPEELVKALASDVLPEFAMKGVVRMLGTTVSNVYARQAILERGVKKVCGNSRVGRSFKLPTKIQIR